ncbi:MAG: serine hydrolase [Phenylobacterium sp.]|uniref:serine hydrolase domain-containing protein n=1 Tax=Phenylobacterium sp. TaxID=1871053 RepID=UPI0025D293F9|nr:serine hydrolase domain-containing protein [Phenylobacterium sp.]MBI1197803.1 serine hydrolase [Phenylobacterium sp.]
MIAPKRTAAIASDLGAAFREAVEADLADLWRKHAAEAGWPGATVRVSLGQGECFVWSAGRARQDADRPMDPETGFHVASVGKMFTAVLMLQLAEAGRLGPRGLNAPLSSFVEMEDIAAVAPVVRDEPITIRQMLNHSSGLRDAFNDDGALLATENGGRPAPGSLGAHLRRALTPDPETGRGWPAWDPNRPGEATAGVLNWFIWGGRAAEALAHRPGARFHYSDTAYMLLALLAERLAGRSYEVLCRERIFAPLGMQDTYLAYGDLAPEGWRSRVADFSYAGRAVFSEGLDASWDWGGGGQISTTADLDTFLRALLSGRLFERPRTGRGMTRWTRPPNLPPGCTGMGLGVRRLRSDRRVDLVGHAGAWSVQAFYVPEFDATITGSFNLPMGLDERLRTWVLAVADRLPLLAQRDPDWVSFPY